jgi:hypothetical protein
LSDMTAGVARLPHRPYLWKIFVMFCKLDDRRGPVLAGARRRYVKKCKPVGRRVSAFTIKIKHLEVSPRQRRTAGVGLMRLLA